MIMSGRKPVGDRACNFVFYLTRRSLNGKLVFSHDLLFMLELSTYLRYPGRITRTKDIKTKPCAGLVLE